MDPRYKSPESIVQDLQTGADDFRDLTRHTTLLGWLLLAGAVGAALSVWSHWLQFQLLSHHYTMQEAQANDLRERTVTLGALAVTLTCFVVFGRWIVVAHRNLNGLGAKDLDVSPGGAVGWFFVPLANLWKPYQAMRTLWKASHDPGHWQYAGGHWVLVVWWTLWVISSLFGSIFFRMSFRATTIPELLEATRSLLINNAIDIPQYLIAWLLVQRIWDAQAGARRRQIAGERPGEPEPRDAAPAPADATLRSV